jgi:hypothetical protein
MDPYKKQIGGAHYQIKIQPSEFINHNRLHNEMRCMQKGKHCI